MPSLLDHLATGDEADLAAASPPAGLLEAVKADGGRRRAGRHRRNLGFAVLLLALVAVPAMALRPGGGGGAEEIGVAAVGDGTETTLAVEPVETPPPTDTVPAAPGPITDPFTAPVTEPITTVPPPSGATPTTAAPRAAPTTTATTARACRNSDDPACGAFRWDPAPSPNQPLVASFTKAPTTTKVGDRVEFEVTWSDRDAQLTHENFTTDGTAIATACTRPPMYGPWTPPPASAGSGRLPYQATFSQPGTYRVIVTLGTASCTSPYGNDTLVEHLIEVSPAG